ncbi:unnamed protein product [Mytilus coruscus]|uniref:Reverse transcriptase domain-containing protein n=1 Tax=Mytilus coruscus TaxID=42192 RepID=A0A6J8AUK4_MYTCO|nr:unnamed protein product [Mytilus coruscus]
MVELGIVPDQWTKGIINSNLKSGSDTRNNPLNYRGITLISVPSKIYCYVLNARLSAWLDDDNILSDEQNGFREKNCCEEHMYTLHTIINDRTAFETTTNVGRGSWCNEWKLHINAGLTQVVHFRNPSIGRSNYLSTCSNTNIGYADSYKYLGLWLDEHLNMNKAVRELAKSAIRALGALYGKFISRECMTHRVFFKLYE